MQQQKNGSDALNLLSEMYAATTNWGVSKLLKATFYRKPEDFAVAVAVAVAVLIKYGNV